MNDALYELHRRTKNATHLKFAKLFDKPCFLGPLAMATPEPGAPQSEIVNTPLYGACRFSHSRLFFPCLEPPEHILRTGPRNA